MRALFQWLELDKSLYRSRWRLFGHVCLAMIIANIGLVGYRIYLAVSPDMDMTTGSDYEIARVATVPLYLPENIDGKIRMARVESLYNKASENPDHETLEEAQHCLAQAIYFEARGEALEGQYAVGEVIINRVLSKDFPNSVCGVISEGANRLNACQFSYNCDGKLETIKEKKIYERILKLSQMLLEPSARFLTSGATFYHSKLVSPSWSKKFIKTNEIGNHVFYKLP